jgi:cell division protein FtsL
VDATNLTGNAELVAWICFIAGVVLLLAGVVIGLYLTFTKAKRDVEEVKKKVEEAKNHVDDLRASAVSGSLRGEANEEAASAATAQAAAAKSTLEEISGIIGSLPENLRFAGLLVLVGVVLMSVATVQFGGHSIF